MSKHWPSARIVSGVILTALTASSLSACSTGSQSAGLISSAALKSSAKLAESPVSEQDDDKGSISEDPTSQAADLYQSLIIKQDFQDFQTQGLFQSITRAVIVRLGKKDFVLSYRFMNKLRQLLADPAYSTGQNEGIVSPGFFTRLLTPAGKTVAASTAESSYTSTYTLGPPEAEFIKAIQVYQAVIMPNFLQEDDNIAESSSSLSALQGTDGIRFIINKSGIRRSFYQAINYALGRQNDSQAGDLSLSGEHVLYDKYISPEKTAEAFSYSGVDQATISPATRNSGSLNKFSGITTAEHNFLKSLLNSGLTVKGAVLLDSAGHVVSGDIDLHFSENDLLNTGSATLGADLMSNFSMLARFEALPRITPDGTSSPKVAKAPDLKLPPAGSSTKPPAPPPEQSGAAAVLAASVLVDAQNTAAKISTLADINGYNYSPPEASELDLANLMPVGVMHQAQRALHLFGIAATDTTALTSGLGYGSLLSAPAASATPLISVLKASCSGVSGSCSSKEFSSSKNLFEVIEQMFAQAYKLGKSTAKSLKNQSAITRFFYANDPADAGSQLDDSNVSKRALIVPTTRAASGAISFSGTGKLYVVITAEPDGNGGLSFYLTDPAAPPFSGKSYIALNTAIPSLVTALYNYSGTLVGVSGAGPELP